MLRSLILISCLLVLSTTSATAAPANTGQAAANPKSLELNEKGVAAIRSKDYPQAEKAFRAALAADRGNLSAVFNLAGMYVLDKRQGAAVELLNEYIKKFPTDPGLHARLGDTYFSMKKVTEASKSYEQAVKLDPTYQGIARKLSSTYIILNKLKDAEMMLLKAVEEAPDDGELLGSLSSVFLANGKPDKAVSAAKRALRVSPKAEIYVTMGTAYELLKDYKNALISMERARDLGDSSKELAEKIDFLKKQTS
jgi:tetratricopeptide (TPR) repeat protein